MSQNRIRKAKIQLFTKMDPTSKHHKGDESRRTRGPTVSRHGHKQTPCSVLRTAGRSHQWHYRKFIKLQHHFSKPTSFSRLFHTSPAINLFVFLPCIP